MKDFPQLPPKGISPALVKRLEIHMDVSVAPIVPVALPLNVESVRNSTCSLRFSDETTFSALVPDGIIFTLVCCAESSPQAAESRMSMKILFKIVFKAR